MRVAQEVRDIDISMMASRAATVTVAVVGSRGRPAGGLAVSVRPSGGSFLALLHTAFGTAPPNGQLSERRRSSHRTQSLRRRHRPTEPHTHTALRPWRASATALGFLIATLSRASAGPSGTLRPCSQLRSVATLMPNSSALRWEHDGISYSLMGRGLTKAEAVQLFLSLRPAGTSRP